MPVTPLAPSLARFLPSGMSATSLPPGESPRLLIAAESPLERWRLSALFPAFRLPAKLRRQALRVTSTLGLLPTHVVPDHSPELHDFVAAHLPDVTASALLIGTDGPAQKLVVQFWRGDRIVAYLKYAEKPKAVDRLLRERVILGQVPEGLGPRVLQAGPLFDGQALLLEAIPGRTLVAIERPPNDAIALLDSLPKGEPREVGDHPWLRAIATYGELSIERYLAVLADRPWPTVFQHGDFAPWNLVRGPDGVLRAIDWEYGVVDGFPHLDSVHYTLQVGLLVHRLSPWSAAARAVSKLTAVDGLPSPTADAIVRLAALQGYLDNQRDGVPPEAPLQAARRSIVTEPS